MLQANRTVIARTDSGRTGAATLLRVRKWIDAGVDLLFPPHCVGCGRLGDWFCETCRLDIEEISPPLCLGCGLPLQGQDAQAGSPSRCNRCRQRSQEWEAQLAYAFHSGPLREAIHQFKYEDMRCLAPVLAGLMAKGWHLLAPKGWSPGAIVPIPLHPSRQRQRGYNQAALLARELGGILHCPVVEGALIRVRATAPQVGLGIEERRANVHLAFRCAEERLRGKDVLLVDDVCTTGSTLASACRALKAAGVASVVAYTLARARPSGLDTQ